MLTTEQKATLKTYILNDPTLSVIPNTLDGAWDIANALNVPANPAFVVWRTSVDPNEVMKNGMDWTRVDNLSVGKARIWEWMTKPGSFNPSRANVRAGIDATWVGTAPDLAVRAAVYVHCKRNATVVEKLFATGTGTDANPASMNFEGAVSPQDVFDSRQGF